MRMRYPTMLVLYMNVRNLKVSIYLAYVSPTRAIVFFKILEQSISKEHCCQVSNDNDTIGVLNSGCDMNEVLQTPIIDENEVSAIINK